MPLLRTDHLTVRQDYGQFHLLYGTGDTDDLVELIDAAIADGDIAQGEDMLVILVPHQNNVEMSLTVERWSVEPPDDLADWEEVFEAPIEVTDDGLEYTSPDDGLCVPLDVPQGQYRARIVGRGFVNRGWPGSITPGDVWRIQLWPSTDDTAARHILRWEVPS